MLMSASVRARVLFLCSASMLFACSPVEAPPAPPPAEVNVVTLAQKAVPLELKYSARTRGEREVEVHARVSGILLKRYYREGEQVATNALLFKIDPTPFDQEVSRLRGLEAVEKARLDEATAQRDRLFALIDKGFVSHRDRDAAVAAHATALASLRAASAALHQAELNLSYTEVRAPIAGTTGRELRSEGSLVEAGETSSLLTTIVQSDRLYVDFSLQEQEAQMVREAMCKGVVAVRLTADGKSEIEQPAKLEFLDTRIDADSGTVPARAVFDNKANMLAAGQFVVARIDGLSSPASIYLPMRAVLHTQEGALSWAVDGESKVQARMIRLGRSAGNMIEVVDGVVAGDRIIVDGILKVQPGAEVKASNVDLNDPPGGPKLGHKSAPGSATVAEK